MLVKWKRELKVTLQSTTSYVRRGQGLGAEGRKQGNLGFDLLSSSAFKTAFHQEDYNEFL